MEKIPGHGLGPDLSGPGRPARSMHIFDRRQLLRRTSISRHFSLENRSLVDFQMGNEPYIAHGHRFPIRKSTKEQVSKKEMNSFSRMALISHTFSFVIHREAMRQKMAILKGGNNVCRDTKCFRYLILSTQRISEPPDNGGRCNRKCRFSRKETAFTGVQKFTEISFYLHKDYNISKL